MTERPAPQAAGEDITVDVLDHAVVVRPVGEMDLDSIAALGAALSAALVHASEARGVVVDCSRLEFCDSSALNALLSARRTAVEAGSVIRLESPNQQLRSLLEMTGTAGLFPLDPEPAG
ncbi:STAS domain-containing protein [Streptomyces sp. NPDC058701]|uniref:STAS domain-containing protein n=1 Tax=Streptomyces sp. NPDC058701 TaxID=3346608 RepID=UPI00364918BA